MVKKGGNTRTGKDKKAERAKRVKKTRKLYERYDISGGELKEKTNFLQNLLATS